ncbi:MAG: hypothetical protein JSS27_16410 [Planctomycetes bacterium]|nr:hypothetical protein [Planctomycetota bacterium]
MPKVSLRTGLTSLIVVAACAMFAVAADAVKTVTGTAPKPTFDKESRELFGGDPLKLLGPGDPGGRIMAATSAGAAPGAPAAPTGGGETAAPAGSSAWSKIITADTIEAEIKGQVPQIADAIKTNPNFKGNGRDKAQISFTMLAALFNVIAQYDGDVKWKKDAIGLRNKYAQVAKNCKTSSDATYKEAKARADDLNELLRGSSVDLPKEEAPDDWVQIAGRPVLMKRLEEARTNKFGPWTSDKGAFGKNKDALMREAQVVTMIAQVIKDKTYDSAEDTEYVGFASDLEKQCLELLDAVKGDNQSAAQSAVSRISKSCDTCHGSYR